MRTVITYGTFDILHRGHINILRQARELGDRLVVGLSSDEFNAGKHKSSLLNFENRKCVLESVKYVDIVIPECTWDQKISDIHEFDVDIFVMGDDWQGKFDELKKYCEVFYIPRTKEISTTLIKTSLEGII
jgi:glycerol-3-phosphate cytidylyltransferase